MWREHSYCNHAGVKAKQVVLEECRDQVHQMINASRESGDIIFTSGGNGANNWVVQSCIQHYNGIRTNAQKPHVITSNIELDSIK